MVKNYKINKITSNGMKAKKSLGQNFLKSEAALRKIIEVGEVKTDEVILEIGPGKGVLTKKLLEHAGLVIAVEKDGELFEFLREKFSKQIKSRALVLVHGDILKFDMGKVIKDVPEHFLGYKIIANIPYNITGAILKKFLTAHPPAGGQPELMILLVQKEVAQRIIAHDKKESILSISVKAYGEPKMIMKVPARYFSPAPKVDSAIISIKNISRKLFAPTPEGVGAPTSAKPNVGEEKFWQIVKTGFAHKRKKLSSNLKILQINAENSHVKTLGNKRAEELSLSDWINLAKEININKKE